MFVVIALFRSDVNVTDVWPALMNVNHLQVVFLYIRRTCHGIENVTVFVMKIRDAT